MLISSRLFLLLVLLGNLFGLGSSCDADQVLCGTTNKCIRISYICDGDNDCGDGLDESFCPDWKATGCSDRATALCNRDGGETCVPMAEYCSSSSSCSGIVDPRICVMMRERVIRRISQVVIPEITTTPPVPSPAPNTLQMSELQGELFAETFNKTLEHSTCPAMYTRVGDHCLSFFYILKLSWGEAVQFCKLMGGQLVSFSSNHDMFISILKHLSEHGMKRLATVGRRLAVTQLSTG
ncbi:sortilin-related receptor-like isoform X2 [Macrobrachium nipponense]|uniref:sortilin-related receptor-like isoform X2 n=1 Tax=Macrobrachium nipponense TaxID=159736 RepID=UPI0030C817DC